MNGYRILIVGLLLSIVAVSFGTGVHWSELNNAENEGYQPYQNAASDPARLETTPIPQSEAFKYKTPCEQPKGETESQLCAEWRATVAAEKAANYTFWGTVFTVVGVVGLIVTIVHGQQGLAAAREANGIARDDGENQARAWLDIETAEFIRMTVGTPPSPRILVPITIANKGGSPAQNITYIAWLCAGYEPTKNEISRWISEREKTGYIENVFHGVEISQECVIEHGGDPLGEAEGFIIIAVAYNTVFSSTIRETVRIFQMVGNRWNDDRIDFENPSNPALKVWDKNPGWIT